MQAPRNWRMKQERYRLIGNTDVDGQASMVDRPKSLARNIQAVVEHEDDTVEATHVDAA